MTSSQVRRACAALVDSLEIPVPFDLARMCEGIGRRRGKPIVLLATPMAMGGGLCGLWLGTAKADYVFYEQDTSQLHQQHIVFHELGHILRRHVPTRILGADLAHALAPGAQFGPVERVLGRDTYSDSDEYEAELIATLTLRRVSRLNHVDSPRAVDSSADDAVARIVRSLSRGDGK